MIKKRRGVKLALLSKEKVALSVKANNWKEAIAAGGKLLVDAGSIEPRYIDAIIQNAIQYGPYFVLTPGVALPHASCTAGVQKVDMSVITLDKELAFLDSPNNPVKLVITLAATESGEHLTLLKKVSEILSNETYVAQVKNAKTTEEVLTIFNS